MKITFAEMREQGVRGILIYCADYHCSHSIALGADRWPDDLRLSDLEPRFVCMRQESCRRAARLQLEYDDSGRDGLSLIVWFSRSCVMPRSSAIAPENTDRDIYLVLEDFGPLGRAWRETGDEQADRRTLIRYLLEGQYEDPIRVVAFNTAQGWSRDVTEEIANELRIRCAESGKTPSKLQAFLDQHRS